MERKRTFFARMAVFLAFILMTNITYAQDKVELKDGSTISCNIKEITEKNVIFQQEGVKDDTTMPISEILTITYANGEKDVFSKVEKEALEVNSTENNVSAPYQKPIQMQSNLGMPNSISNDNEFKHWNGIFRIGPSFFKSPKEEGTYSHSFGYEMIVGGKYNFDEYLGLNFGIGWWSSSNSSSIFSREYGVSKVEGKSNHVIIPVELSLYLPISKRCGLIFEVGPSITYGINGYTKNDGEKITWKDYEKEYNDKIDRFGCFLKVGGGINLWDFHVQGHFGIPLTKDNYGGKQKNFWGITIGSTLFSD